MPQGFGSLEEFWRFWDTHSSADYENLMVPVDSELDLHLTINSLKERLDVNELD